MEIWRWRQLYHLSVRWPSLSLFHKRGNRRPALSAAGRGPAAGHGAAGRLLPAGQGSLRLYRTLRGGPGRGAFQPGNGRIVFHSGPGHSQILFRMLRKAASCSFRAAVRPSCSGQESGPGLNTLLCTQKPCAGRGAANAGAAFYRSTRFSRPPRRLNISFEIVPACSARSQAVSSWSPDRPMRVAASPGETDGISVTSTKV